MRNNLVLVAALVLAAAGSAAAQDAVPAMDHDAMAMGSAEPAKLPAACDAAAGKTDMPSMKGGMDGMADLDPVQTANHEAMKVMDGPMMAAAMIKDPDLAFNCGMIAHHQGAIAMARVELAMGKDATSKALAEAIIAAQEKEIADMTAWVEQNAK